MTLTKKGQHRNINDITSENSDTGGDLGDPMRPWFTEWNLYMNTNEMIAKDMKIIQWWGVHFIYLKLYNILNSYLAQCTLVSYVGVSRTRLPIHYGIIYFK